VKRRSDYPAYLAMRAALAALRVLPRGAALAAGASAGRAAWRLGMRRRVTEDNLAVAFPELSEGERRVLARRVFEHFGRMTVDSLRLSATGASALVPHVQGGEALELVRAGLARGKGLIILTGHVGNWELAGAYVAASGFPLAAVVKPPSNPYIARHTERVRLALGIESIDMPEATIGVTQVLRANRAVALVADQGALRSNLWTPFFGRPTKTPMGPGLFAVRTGAPVVFGALIARPDGGYELMAELLFQEMSGDPEDAGRVIGEAYRNRLEAVVRRVPDQYLWTHRLWKQQPPG
jgi:Kdo2-lipid IVA lauroyltransferase/acyltransferase